MARKIGGLRAALEGVGRQTGAVTRSARLRSRDNSSSSPQEGGRRRGSPARSAPTFQGGGGGGGSRSFSVPTFRPAQNKEDDKPEFTPFSGQRTLRGAEKKDITYEPMQPIVTADEALKSYETKKGLKPGTLSDPETVPTYDANEALKGVEKKQGLKPGTYSTRDDSPQAQALKALKPRRLEVRELSQEEWNALSPQQQQGVIANYSLYQASQADKELALKGNQDDETYTSQVSEAFGEDGGSDTYAPNTMQVLSELGYKNDARDLDEFLNGAAIADSRDVRRSIDKGAEGTAKIFADLSNSPIFETDTVTAALDGGAKLLEALQVSDSQTQALLSFADAGSAASKIPGDRLEELNALIDNMGNREIYGLISTDDNDSKLMQDDIDAVTEGIDPNLIAQYMRETYVNPNNDPAYMTQEEFIQTWLQGGK